MAGNKKRFITPAGLKDECNFRLKLTPQAKDDGKRLDVELPAM